MGLCSSIYKVTPHPSPSGVLTTALWGRKEGLISKRSRPYESEAPVHSSTPDVGSVGPLQPTVPPTGQHSFPACRDFLTSRIPRIPGADFLPRSLSVRHLSLTYSKCGSGPPWASEIKSPVVPPGGRAEPYLSESHSFSCFWSSSMSALDPERQGRKRI